MKSYSRPGVEAAVRLTAIKDRAVWENVFQQYKPMLLEKKGGELIVMDDWCENLSHKLQRESHPYISKDDLIKIIEWKFAKGKPRPYMKLVKANTDSVVKECSEKAFAEAKGQNFDKAFDEITKLKGMGVAGASAVLSLCCPDRLSFMDDEVIESLYDGKRGYTREIYNIVNKECNALAQSLGNGWTPRKVGMTLWTASRIHACGGEDFTLIDKQSVIDDSKSQPNTTRSVKRRKT